MPELPEVETVKTYLKNQIIGKKILSCFLMRKNLRYDLDQTLTTITKNTTINDITRAAKYLVIYLDNEYSIIIHLGMSGRFTLASSDYQLQKHDHVKFVLSDGTQLIYNDARRFGMVYLSQTKDLNNQDYFKNSGIEPLSPEFNTNYLVDKVKNKKIAIKKMLMDNKIVVGIGNIYASESLFLAGVNPEKEASNLNENAIDLLIKAIREVLNNAIAKGGTTLKDFVGGDNKPGYFKQELNVYNRDGKPCVNCNELIAKIVQGGRASFYCPNCQK